MGNTIHTYEDAFRELTITNIQSMLGEVFTEVVQSDDDLVFYTEDGRTIRFRHFKDCCENVEIEDVCGDLNDLLNSPITQAEEVRTREYAIRPLEWSTSHTWTFYRFATAKGSVVVRWLGESNGYYSERVDIVDDLRAWSKRK